MIGYVAKKAEMSVQAVRYYEKLGLITPLSRRQSGYRVYDDRMISRLRFIRRAQGAGFSLKDMSVILRWRESGKADCEKLRKMAEEKSAALAGQAAKLRKTLRNLARLRRLCNAAKACEGSCRLLDLLEGD